MKIKKKLNNNVAVVTDKTETKSLLWEKELLMTRKQETVLM